MLRTGYGGRTVPGAASSRIPCKESISVKYAGDARTAAAAPAIQIQNTLSPANSVILEDEDHTPPESRRATTALVPKRDKSMARSAAA